MHPTPSQADAYLHEVNHDITGSLHTVGALVGVIKTHRSVVNLPVSTDFIDLSVNGLSMNSINAARLEGAGRISLPMVRRLPVSNIENLLRTRTSMLIGIGVTFTGNCGFYAMTDDRLTLAAICEWIVRIGRAMNATKQKSLQIDMGWSPAKESITLKATSACEEWRGDVVQFDWATYFLTASGATLVRPVALTGWEASWSRA